jgi:hypothetical protein
MSDLESEVEDQFEIDEDSREVDETERLLDFEIDEDSREVDETERLLDFEIDEDSRYKEAENYDPLVEKYSERLYEIASRVSPGAYEFEVGLENDFDEAIMNLQKEMFGSWFKKKWKQAKKIYGNVKKLTKNPLIKFAIDQARANIPAFRAIDIASKVLTSPAAANIKNLMKAGIGLANSGSVPSGFAGMQVLKGLGITPGAGIDANKGGLRNLVQVASDYNKQLADQAINNSAASDPVEGPKIAAAEFEVAINKNIANGKYVSHTQTKNSLGKKIRVRKTKIFDIPRNARRARMTLVYYE